MRLLLPLLIWSLLLSSCTSSPPAPPTVDKTTRRPANSPTLVELQARRNELHNTRILANESGRLAESATLALHRAAQQRVVASSLASPATPAAGNAVFTVHFGHARTEVALSPIESETLLGAARTAPLIVLRGRTDGRTETPAESRIARERADAVRLYLIRAGVDGARIRSTHQAVGDPVADNTTSAGRSLNRRVEVEIYRTLPTALGQANALGTGA